MDVLIEFSDGLDMDRPKELLMIHWPEEWKAWKYWFFGQRRPEGKR